MPEHRIGDNSDGISGFELDWDLGYVLDLIKTVSGEQLTVVQAEYIEHGIAVWIEEEGHIDILVFLENLAFEPVH